MKVNKLTAEQMNKLPEYRKMYLDKFFANSNPANKEDVRNYMKWIYSTFNISKNKNPIVILVNSPYEINVAILYAKKIYKKFGKNSEVGNEVFTEVENEVENEVWNEVENEVWNEVGNEVWNEVENEVENEVGNEVGNEVENEVWNEVENEVWNEVFTEVGNEVWNEVWNEVGNEVWNEVGNEVWNEIWNEIWNEVENEVENEVGSEELVWYSPSYYLSAFNSWISYCDYFDKQCFELEKSKVFNKYKIILDLNIFWSVAFENIIFVSRNATKYLRDSLKKLHSVFEPAIKFGGKFGYHLFYIHGVNIKRPLFKRLSEKNYTFDEWVKEPTEEVRSAILSFMEERWGSEYLFRFISDNLKEADTYIDKKNKEYLKGTTGGMNLGVYTLFKGVLNGLELAFVRCYCPSTDRMFFLSVSSENKNAKDAIASLYRVPLKLRDEIKYIQRQGERFSTVFTDKGKEIINQMDESETTNLTSISGSEYFSKMKYEF